MFRSKNSNKLNIGIQPIISKNWIPNLSIFPQEKMSPQKMIEFVFKLWLQRNVLQVSLPNLLKKEVDWPSYCKCSCSWCLYVILPVSLCIWLLWTFFDRDCLFGILLSSGIHFVKNHNVSICLNKCTGLLLDNSKSNRNLKGCDYERVFRLEWKLVIVVHHSIIFSITRRIVDILVSRWRTSIIFTIVHRFNIHLTQSLHIKFKSLVLGSQNCFK